MPLELTQEPPYYQIVSEATPDTQKIYTAKITQTGTDDPVATILENTLSAPIVWTRSSLGNYIGTLADAFPDTNTIFPAQTSNMVNHCAGSTTTFDRAFTFGRTGNNTVQISTYDENYTPIEWSAMIPPPNYIMFQVKIFD